MTNNYIETLDELFRIKNEKKKKEFTKTERDQFCTAWVQMASAEGYSQKAEQYLYDGSSYCGSRPFKEFLDSVQNKEETLTYFFSGKLYGKDTGVTFRLLAHLFALLINDMNTGILVTEIIRHFPRACINKEKKRLGTVNQTLLKYFFAELEPNAQFPSLSEMKINPGVMAEFVETMDSILNSIEMDNLSSSKVHNIKNVRNWLAEYRKLQSKSIDAIFVANEEKNMELKKDAPKPQLTSVLVDESFKSEATSSIGYGSTDLVTCFTDLLNQAGKVASAIKGECSQYKNKIEHLTRSLEREQKKLTTAEQQIADKQEIISSLQQKLSMAEDKILTLKKTVIQKDALIEEKDVEIVARTELADVLSRERLKQADEVLQRIASKIRVEYRDFKDAADAPMSCDLGENLRLQLQSVFDILEKSVMKIQ